ncbi:hypothetical protein [Deinococcus sonorensis]|uniref:Uncharacterized protein n=2 Tax=Deinococcus sonorensis TaxID=309891 RepID=A0AAU7UEQ7_9DEIO
MTGYDWLWSTMPLRYFSFEEQEGVWYQDVQGGVASIGFGAVGRQVVSRLHHAVAGC